MRDFFRSPLFRCLVCLILVCCILVNCSPIQTEAFSAGATLTAVVGTAAAVAVVAGAMQALGVMPDSSDTSVFEGVVNDCVDALTASGVFLNGMVSVLQLSDGVVVKNHVNQGIIEAILDWLFAEEVVTEGPVPLSYQGGSTFNFTFNNTECSATCDVDFEPFFYYCSYGSSNAFSCGVYLYCGSQGGYFVDAYSNKEYATYYNGSYFCNICSLGSSSVPEELPSISNFPDANILNIGHVDSFDNIRSTLFNTSLWDFFLDKILSLLPLSPFREYISYFEGWEFIGYLNWFFPFRGIFIVLEVWLRAVALYYLYSAGMRWLKLMGQ